MVAARAPGHRDAEARDGRPGRWAACPHALSEARAGGLPRAGAPGFPAPAPPSPTLVSLAAGPCGTRSSSELGRPEARDGGAWSAGRALAWLGNGNERDYPPGEGARRPRPRTAPSPGPARPGRSPAGSSNPALPPQPHGPPLLARQGRGEKEGVLPTPVPLG